MTVMNEELNDYDKVKIIKYYNAILCKPFDYKKIHEEIMKNKLIACEPNISCMNLLLFLILKKMSLKEIKYLLDVNAREHIYNHIELNSIYLSKKMSFKLLKIKKINKSMVFLKNNFYLDSKSFDNLLYIHKKNKNNIKDICFNNLNRIFSINLFKEQLNYYLEQNNLNAILNCFLISMSSNNKLHYFLNKALPFLKENRVLYEDKIIELINRKIFIGISYSNTDIDDVNKFLKKIEIIKKYDNMLNIEKILENTLLLTLLNEEKKTNDCFKNLGSKNAQKIFR